MIHFQKTFSISLISNRVIFAKFFIYFLIILLFLKRILRQFNFQVIFSLLSSQFFSLIHKHIFL